MFGPPRSAAALRFEMLLANELGTIPGATYDDFKVTKLDDDTAKITVTASKIIPMGRLAEMRAEVKKGNT